MNWPASVDSATESRRSESNRKSGPSVLWPWIVVLATIVFLVLTLDASLTGDPRIALFEQGGIQP
jgi:hypothetical protein